MAWWCDDDDALALEEFSKRVSVQTSDLYGMAYFLDGVPVPRDTLVGVMHYSVCSNKEQCESTVCMFEFIALQAQKREAARSGENAA